MKIFLFILILAVIGLAFFISRRPDNFKVSRSAIMNAPVEAVFAQINDLRNFNTWSPWAKLDPDAKVSFEGTQTGTGASMLWDGNNKVGAGRMEITESVPNEKVAMKLDFYKPMKGNATSDFILTPQDGGTLVTWSMYGENNFIAKAMSLVMDCEKMVGGLYEEGLANMKALVEAPKAQ